MKLCYKQSSDVPVIDDVDILVIGAGPGGIGAVVTAARQGCSVALAEHYGFPGGMAVAGEVTPFMPNHTDEEPLDRPLYLEWINRMRSYIGGAAPTECHRHDVRSRDIGRYPAMLAAEDMLLDAGVRLYYHHTFFDTVVNDGRIDGVIFNGKSGLSAIRAKVVIDSTGDGDAAVRAGCRFEYGNADGLCQPMTLCFKLSHLDKSRMPERSELNRLYRAAQERGEVSCPRENVLYFIDFDDDVMHYNTTRIIRHDGTNAESLSEAEVIGRKQLRELLKFFRTHVPGFEKCEIHSVGAQIGVRESRRIICREFLTVKAFENLSRYPDAIARINYPIDIHNPGGGGTVERHLGNKDFYEIPYGCIVPLEVKNLLIGSRCISVDHVLHSSMRIMPPVCTIGQAAGMAAALAVSCKCSPQEVDGVELRRKLRDFGAFI